jgi:tetratricopeptide (TPR) repeat protein
MNFLKAMFWCLVLTSCGGKQDNQQLAHTYCKMALNDMAEDGGAAHGYKRALLAIDKALDCDQRPEYYACKGAILFKLGDYVQSEHCYDRALAGHPDAPLASEIINNRACLCAQRNDYAAAKKMWHCLTRDTTYQTPEVAWVNLGKAYIKERNLAQAQQAFEHAVNLAPSYVDAHFYLSLVERERGEHRLARREADLVLKMEPGHQGASVLMAQIESTQEVR